MYQVMKRTDKTVPETYHEDGLREEASYDSSRRGKTSDSGGRG